MSRSRIAFGCLATAVFIAGCSGNAPPPASIDGGEGSASFESTSAPEPESFPQTITSQTEYYTTSPAQGRPPDGTFAAGTKVRIRRNTGSYSLVKSEAGVEGYVRTDAMGDAQPSAP